jgi:hypothetical protein
MRKERANLYGILRQMGRFPVKQVGPPPPPPLANTGVEAVGLLKAGLLFITYL